MGRALGNALINLGLEDASAPGAARSSGYDLEELRGAGARRGPGQRRPGPAGGLLPRLDGHPGAARPTATASATTTASSTSASSTARQVEEPGQLAALRQPLGDRAARVPLSRCSFYGRVERGPDADGRLRFEWVDTRGRPGHGLRHADPRLRQRHRQHPAPLGGQEPRASSTSTTSTHGDYVRRRRGQGAVGEHLQGALPQRQRLRGQGAAPEAGVLLRLGHAAGHHPPLPQEPRAAASGDFADQGRPSSSTTPTRPSPSPS